MATATTVSDKNPVPFHQEDIDLSREKQADSIGRELDVTKTEEGNLVYDDVDEEPELHTRTYIALAAFFLLNYVQVYALQGPPLVLSWIGADLNGVATQTWVPVSLSLVQSVLSPLVASASDTFQARKAITVGSCLFSLVGCAIAPGSKDIYRLIAAQCLIGVGFAAVPLAYAVPSEILPRRWRPLAQAMANVAAALACSQAPLSIGALTRNDPHQGWRTFYWIQLGMWGATAIGIFAGYRPPKRHTRYDHLSIWQKIGSLDLPGLGLLTLGLTLFLVGVNLGGSLYPWTNSRVLSTMVLGIVILVGFCIYEWKGTKTGFLHHDLFRGGKNYGRSFALSAGLIAVESAQLFAYIIFYPVLTTALFEQNPFLLAARAQPFWIAACVSTVIWGWMSTRFRTIREPLLAGFIIYTAGYVGWSTVQPSDDTNTLIFGGLAGIGFGAPLILIVTAAQLSTPHKLIATATSVITTSRAVASAVFTAVFGAVLSSKLSSNIPKDIAGAVLGSGLPEASLPSFIGAIASGNTTSLPKIPGVTPAIIAAGVGGLKQAFANSLRVIFIISAGLGVLGCIMCCFLGSFRDQMNYMVEAPVEELHAKHHHRDPATEA